MALQGTLKDFSITEILQLIGQQLKTGILKIRRGKKVVEIYFVDGMIIHVHSNYRGQKDLLGEILVKAQLITGEQLERVLRIQKETLKYLGEILVELQLLGKKDVVKVLATQVYETIYDLFWWDEGYFNFDLKLVESYKKIPFALSTEQVLLHILRMVDEWPEMEKKISSPYWIFQKALGPEGKPADLSPSDLKQKLSAEQEMVYNLVDGSRTVQDIIDRSLLGRFKASENLVDLLEMRLIETSGMRTPSLVNKVKSIDFKEAFFFYGTGTSLLLVFLILFYVKPNYLYTLLNSKIERADIRAPSHYIYKTQLNRIKNALEIYKLEKGRYPDLLEELISAQLLRKDDLYYSKGVSYQYELRDGKYFLKH
jgi:hypothetical protein